MTSTARLLGAGVELQQRYARTDSLREACGLLLAEIQECTPLSRMALVVDFEGHGADATLDVTPGEIGTLHRVLRDARRDGARPEVRQNGAGPWHLPPLPSFRAPRPVPVASDDERLGALLVVDAPPDVDDFTLATAEECARLAAIHLRRIALLEVLNARLRDAEAREARFRGALDSLPDPVLVLDSENRTLHANRRAEALFAAASGDSAGRRHAVETNNLFFSGFRAKAMLGTEGRPEASELVLVDPVDGSDLMFEVFKVSFAGTQHRPGLIFILRDITDLKKASVEMEVQYGRSLAMEHAARSESQRLNVIIENVGAPILVTDRRTNVSLMNREAERLLDPGPGAPGDADRHRTIQHNDAKLAGLINDFLLQPETRRENRLAMTDPDARQPFPVLAVSTKILNERREPTAVVTVLHDLTQEVENRQLAEDLRQLNAGLEARVAKATSELAERNAALERASRVKSEFLATMSHELRTPINSMLGYNALLRDGLLGAITDAQRHALDRVHAAAGHLLALINDILDLSMVEAGHLELRPTRLELAQFLVSISEDIQPLATAKGLDYRLEIQPDASALSADPTRLRQVLFNLLSNAVKFTDSGGITLRALATPDRPGSIRFEVEDTGVGIAPDDVELIFEEFRQVDQSPTRKHKGTGLGLAISRKLIQLMGGALGVRSEPGLGATFHVDLPVRRNAPAHESPGWP